MELLTRTTQILLLLIAVVLVIALTLQASPQPQYTANGYADATGYAADNPRASHEAHTRYTAPAIIKERKSQDQ